MPNQPTHALQSCEHPIAKDIRILVTGASYVEPSLAAKYPYQEEWAAQRHDLMVEHYLKAFHPYAKFVSFVNLTRGGFELNRDTSDGIHGLTGVNVAKALTVMNIIARFGTDDPTHPYDPEAIKQNTFRRYIKELTYKSVYIPWANHENGYNAKYLQRNMTWTEELQKHAGYRTMFTKHPTYLFKMKGYVNMPNHYDRDKELYGGTPHPTPAPGHPRPLPTNKQREKGKGGKI